MPKLADVIEILRMTCANFFALHNAEQAFLRAWCSDREFWVAADAESL
jgi:hypothetical protein